MVPDTARQQARLVADLSAPLVDRGQARREHQGRLADHLHGCEADDGLARAWRRDDVEFVIVPARSVHHVQDHALVAAEGMAEA